MIFVCCTDDDGLFQVAQRTAAADPATFGACHRAFQSFAVREDEDLFITAHGARRGDHGVPVIGDEADDFFLDAMELMANLAPGLPATYRGRVYISACESADRGRDGFSFAEGFRARLQAARPRAGKVYGQKGNVGMRIPPPGDPGWTQA